MISKIVKTPFHGTLVKNDDTSFADFLHHFPEEIGKSRMKSPEHKSATPFPSRHTIFNRFLWPPNQQPPPPVRNR